MSLHDVDGRGESACPRKAGGPRLRFRRSSRLTARRQFLTVYRRGQKARSTSLTLFALPNSVGGCRLGITVTRKVGGAVRRNLVKRRIREIFRRNPDAFAEGLDLVVNAHPGIQDVPLPSLEREFLRCFARLTRRTAV